MHGDIGREYVVSETSQSLTFGTIMPNRRFNVGMKSQEYNAEIEMKGQKMFKKLLII